MVENMGHTKRKYAACLLAGIFAVILFAVVIGAVFLRGTSKNQANLALRKGVIATSDSTENESLSAYMAIDGDDSTLSSRWSSENNWEDASHYIQLEFPEEISVSFVVLKWERRNAVSYALEGSLDGETWTVLQSFDTAPEMKHQEIALEEAARVRFLRLSTYAVSMNEGDYSNLYQNISLYEFEVYADKPAAYRLETARIGCGEAGGRYLVMPEAPEGYEVTYLGADYEQIIGEDGVIYPTIQEKEVTVGFRVSSVEDASDTREIAQKVTVPSYLDEDDKAPDKAEGGPESGLENLSAPNACPEVIPALAEWKGGSGRFVPAKDLCVIVEKGSALEAVAALFADGYEAVTQRPVEVKSGSVEDMAAGDIYLGYADAAAGLGEEGYFCDISDKCVILAETDTGVRWGTVTLLQILSRNNGIPQGQIRDYPRYEVRGFGIDVARKPVSLDTLYAMMETMSFYKMNDLTIHLNDNEILSTSGLTDSVEQAMTADSAFRLESDLTGEDGKKLTSSEYAYTKEEFARFIETAKTYGVTVVPEIDTPAHSLSITQRFPSYALKTGPEAVDQIDLSNREAVEFVKSIWQEALSGEDAAFRDAGIVNIGMDEYYGDGEQYRKYLQEIAELVQSEGRTVRLWGSLSNMPGTTMPDPENLQMNIWSTVWADPRDMYEAGYSLINMQNNHLYVIPGGGYDHLDTKDLYDNWEPNKFYDYNLLEKIPVYSPQMLGAVYMLWNDMCGRLDVGISEYDLYDRFAEPLPVLSAGLWGERAASGYEAFMDQAEQIGQASEKLRGGKNRIYDEETGLEPYYEVDIRVKLSDEAGQYTENRQAGNAGQAVERTEGDPGTGSVAAAEEADGASTRGTMADQRETVTISPQIIAESASAYGTWAFYAVEPETGRVGFAREGRTYTWEYELPREEWVELKVVGETGRTSLYVNGSFVGTLGNEKAFEEYATFVFPTERIGEETGQFTGEITFGAVKR